MINQLDNPNPTREELWVVVQEAHDYLYTLLTDPTSFFHPVHGPIEFDSSYWGYRTQGVCKVCVAGLWALQKHGVFLGEVYGCMSKPPIPDCLDDLRYPQVDDGCIERWLGVKVPPDIADKLVADKSATDPDGWDSDNPEHILIFLAWLLQQRDTKTESN